MTDREVEELLLRYKSGLIDDQLGPPLQIDAAIAHRNAGNVPDAEGRVLRLVLRIDGDGAEAVEERRLLFEPDFHRAPTWRREGSRAVNVIPLGVADQPSGRPWWEEPRIAELEASWARSGEVDGVKVPPAYRGFVYKTVLALKRAGVEVEVRTIADSAARWLPPDQAEKLRTALTAANTQHAEEPGP